MVLEVVLVVLEVVLVVLEVTGPQVSVVKFQTRLSLMPHLYSPAPPIWNFNVFSKLLGGPPPRSPLGSVLAWSKQHVFCSIKLQK